LTKKNYETWAIIAKRVTPLEKPLTDVSGLAGLV